MIIINKLFKPNKMKYYYLIEGQLRNNIGDVLQGMVAKPFLPLDAMAADREAMAEIDVTQPGFLLANGWYMHNFTKFPPPENITPLYISVHIANSQMLSNENVREHFKKHSPIGCRDKKTLKLFLGWGIPAYYSGCLTITSKAMNGSTRPEIEEVLLVDNVDHQIPEEVKTKLESLLGKELVRVSHDPPDNSGSFQGYVASSTVHMKNLLERYCKAQLVITTKIHCALPCLGMGARVMLIHPNPDDPRLETVKQFLNIYSYRDILELKEMKYSKVDEKKLNKKKEFLSGIVIGSIQAGKNIVNAPNTPELKRLNRRSFQQAKLYNIAVRLMYQMGINKKKISAVYGAAFK